jgi:hypothetical protein
MDGRDEFCVLLPNISPVYFQRERDGINHVAWNSAQIRPAIDEQVALQITTFAFFVSGEDGELGLLGDWGLGVEVRGGFERSREITTKMEVDWRFYCCRAPLRDQHSEDHRPPTVDLHRTH